MLNACVCYTGLDISWYSSHPFEYNVIHQLIIIKVCWALVLEKSIELNCLFMILFGTDSQRCEEKIKVMKLLCEIMKNEKLIKMFVVEALVRFHLINFCEFIVSYKKSNLSTHNYYWIRDTLFTNVIWVRVRCRK